MKTLFTLIGICAIVQSAVAQVETIRDQDIIVAMEANPTAITAFAEVRRLTGNNCSYDVRQNQAEASFRLTYTCISEGAYEEGGESAAIVIIDGVAYSRDGIHLRAIRYDFAG